MDQFCTNLHFPYSFSTLLYGDTFSLSSEAQLATLGDKEMLPLISLVEKGLCKSIKVPFFAM